MKYILISIALLLHISIMRGQEALALNQLDARESPAWITEGVMYQIQPRAFTPEGTLKAATMKLRDVAKLGVTVIYLCPVFLADDDPNQESWSTRQKASGMNNPRNPYRMKDFYHVDPEYGTDIDLKDFVAEAHRLGMRVMLDMVYLHCGPKALFLQNHPDFIKRGGDGKPVNASWSFPALNFESDELREYLWQNMEYWVKEFFVDGFRCDVSDGVPLDFWETARDRLEKIRIDIGMLAEGRRKEDQLKAFDLSYGFGWHSALEKVYSGAKPVSFLKDTLEAMAQERPRGARFIRYTDNHDIANDDWNNRIEKQWTTKGVDASLLMTFTLDGMPMLYNGQEVADLNRHSIFGRMPIDWNNGTLSAGKERFILCQQLCKIRQEEKALTYGPITWLENSVPEKIISYVREYKGDKIWVIINLTDQPQKVSIKGVTKKMANAYRCLIERDVNRSSTNEFDIQGYGYWVGKIGSSDN